MTECKLKELPYDTKEITNTKYDYFFEEKIIIRGKQYYELKNVEILNNKNNIINAKVMVQIFMMLK